MNPFPRIFTSTTMQLLFVTRLVARRTLALLFYNNNIIKYKNMNNKKRSRKLVEAAIKMNVSTYYT